MPDYQCITTTQIDDVFVVSFNDHKVMDPNRIQILGDELLSLVGSDSGPEKIVINLENVRFLSSAAINKLIVLEKRLKSKNGGIKVSNLTPEVNDVFMITHLHDVFEICDDQRDAIEAFRS